MTVDNSAPNRTAGWNRVAALAMTLLAGESRTPRTAPDEHPHWLIENYKGPVEVGGTRSNAFELFDPENLKEALESVEQEQFESMKEAGLSGDRELSA